MLNSTAMLSIETEIKFYTDKDGLQSGISRKSLAQLAGVKEADVFEGDSIRGEIGLRVVNPFISFQHYEMANQIVRVEAVVDVLTYFSSKGSTIATRSLLGLTTLGILGEPFREDKCDLETRLLLSELTHITDRISKKVDDIFELIC